MATKKPSAAQLAARKLFASRSRAGFFEKQTDKDSPSIKREKQKSFVKKIPAGKAKETRMFYILEVSKENKHWEFTNAYHALRNAKTMAEIFAENNPDYYVRVRDIRVLE